MDMRPVLAVAHPLQTRALSLLNRFSYLERHGDIQMLALLSCVFKEPFRNSMAVTGSIPVSHHHRYDRIHHRARRNYDSSVFVLTKDF